MNVSRKCHQVEWSALVKLIQMRFCSYTRVIIDGIMTCLRVICVWCLFPTPRWSPSVAEVHLLPNKAATRTAHKTANTSHKRFFVMLGEIGLGILNRRKQSSWVQLSNKQVFTVVLAQIHRWLKKKTIPIRQNHWILREEIRAATNPLTTQNGKGHAECSGYQTKGEIGKYIHTRTQYINILKQY